MECVINSPLKFILSPRYTHSHPVKLNLLMYHRHRKKSVSIKNVCLWTIVMHRRHLPIIWKHAYDYMEASPKGCVMHQRSWQLAVVSKLCFCLQDIKISTTSSLPDVILELKPYCACTTHTIVLQVAKNHCHVVQRLLKCWQSLRKIEHNPTSGNGYLVNICCVT